MSDKSYDCWNCCDYGCPCCEESDKSDEGFSLKARDGSIVERINEYVPEPWPMEEFKDSSDRDLEELVCNLMDELARRGKVNARLEGWYAL